MPGKKILKINFARCTVGTNLVYFILANKTECY